ncbi:uncharacterized protein LOC123510997 isoform X1 [Portunus trituberculatus]|uniref:uncharacterized protein LOC123510997 isoform X1 n=1 Tax=Portunus trituberculatus TaxID=210409 RepID=UPI001E1CCA89|nr:uncharacterized protein LOC123510997 isoform X1 [Portunus trituberculatus]
MWAWLWAAASVWAWVEATTPTTPSRSSNVVAEVPGLDVGPLVAVSVSRGDTATLPCQYPPHPDDTANLVLWYLNNTSRPFLSFDARSEHTDGGGNSAVSRRSRRAVTHQASNHVRRRKSRSVSRSRWSRSVSRELEGPFSRYFKVTEQHISRHRREAVSKCKMQMGSRCRGRRSRGRRQTPRRNRRKSRSISRSRNTFIWDRQSPPPPPPPPSRNRWSRAAVSKQNTPRKPPSANRDTNVISGSEEKQRSGGSRGEGGGSEQEGGVNKEDLKSGRVRLERGGSALVVEKVTLEDTAEYRCRVHYRLSQTWTQRLLLSVQETVTGLEIVDSTERSVQAGAALGPFKEGSHLRLSCRARHGGAKVESLVWLIDGVAVESSWAVSGVGTVHNVLEIGALSSHHHQARLTCRLTTHANTQVAANITDLSVTITMYHVPETRITVDGGQGVGSEAGHMATEGSDLTFLCSVTAHPPAYNVTWLHNGRVVGEGGRRWRKDERRLQVSPIRREDAGLYTCLASNSEGDGHSNALQLRVARPPQCRFGGEKRIKAAVNTSVTLTCTMDALPTNLTFTWKQTDPLPDPSTPHLRGGVITGDAPPRRHPGLIDLTPGNPQEEKEGKEGDRGGRTLLYEVSSSDPLTSTVALPALAPAHVFCYARNSVGRTTIPCSFTLTLVDPPQPIRDCNVTIIGVTRLEVKCHDLALRERDPDHLQQINLDPDLSFVRSPEVKPSANLEVWSGGTLVANVSSPRPELSVGHLSPNTPYRLLLYAVTPDARSTPLLLHARTPRRPPTHVTETPRAPPDPGLSPQHELEQEGEGAIWESLGGSVGGVVGGLLGGMGIVMLLLTIVVVMVRQRRHRRSEGGDSDGRGMGTDACTLDAPSRSLKHGPHSASHSSLNVDARDPRDSVYCMRTGEGRPADPWQETSLTPLVALSTPLTPPPGHQVSPGPPQDTLPGDVK